MRNLGYLGLLLTVACAAAPAGGGDDILLIDARGGGGPDGGTGGDAAAPIDAPTNGLPALRRCTGRAFTPTPAAGVATLGGTLTAVGNAANPSGEDIVTPPGTPAAARARFSYGTTAAALDQEPVAVWLDDCDGWRSLGTHPTAAGLIDVPIDGALTPGIYEARFEVLGDATVTVSYLWILPTGTHLAVTDIDGTLTTSDTELFVQILLNSYVPTAYPSAVELTTSHAAKRHVVVYMTGRPSFLSIATRQWLTDLGFAPGPLHLTSTPAESLPTDTGVGDYKKAFLQSLTAKGYRLDLAYGNATTDIYAYEGAGLADGAQWIIGPNAGMNGTNAVMDTWAARVTEVQASPMVQQPFMP
jgi:hypothetical protein